MLILLLLLELVLLYFLSRWLTQTLYRCFLLIFRARSAAVSAITLLLFPGTVIHELSHLFTAEILGVATGKLTLAPENIRDQNIKIGAVAIAPTGPLRRAVIGLAPLFAGLLSLAALSYFLRTDALHWSDWSDWSDLLLYYLIFSISNSMFSSREDLRGFWPLAITLGLFMGAAYAFGLRIGLEGRILEVVTTALSSLVQSLGFVLAVNGGLLLTLQVLVVLTRKLLR